MNDGTKNLVPTNERTKEEQREIAQAGGKKSGKVRKERKSMKETWDVIRKLPMTDGDALDIDTVQNIGEAKGANLTVEQSMILAIAARASKGDVKAFQALSRYTETQNAVELANRKAELEIAKLEAELDAYKKAVERAESGQVMIVDDIESNKAE